MNNFEIPDDQLIHRLWQELSRAPHDRHHEWRTPTLATQGLGNNGPQARTVGCSGKRMRLRITCVSSQMHVLRNVQNLWRNPWLN